MIELRIDTDPLIDQLSAVSRRHAPYAVANGLNRTAKEIAEAVRARVFQRGFRIRSSQSAAFIRAAIPDPKGIMQASKTRLRAFVNIGEGLGKSVRYTVLPTAEAGGVRTGTMAMAGSYGPRIPVPIRASQGEMIPRAMYPANLGLQQRRKISGGTTGAKLQGKQRTFVVPSKRTGDPIVMQRVGRNEVRALFVMKRAITVGPRNFFFPTASRVYRDRTAINIAGFMQLAIATAR